MKKLIYFTLIAFFIMTGASFAWKVDSSGPDSLSHGSIDAKASKNVTIEVVSSSQAYAASAGHYSGNKVYGVTSGSSLIKYKTKDTGEDWATEANSGDINGWSSM